MHNQVSLKQVFVSLTLAQITPRVCPSVYLDLCGVKKSRTRDLLLIVAKMAVTSLPYRLSSRAILVAYLVVRCAF